MDKSRANRGYNGDQVDAGWFLRLQVQYFAHAGTRLTTDFIAL
jgi:hypothetical protein